MRSSIRLTGILLFITGIVGAQAARAAEGVEGVEGTYVGNGREAKLAHVRIIAADPWQDETSYAIILSEKDPSESDKPDFDAMFGELGDALVISVTATGDIFSTQVCHQELEKSGFSTSGTLQIESFSIADGMLSARFFTDGEQEFFGDVWEVDLTVTGKLP